MRWILLIVFFVLSGSLLPAQQEEFHSVHYEHSLPFRNLGIDSEAGWDAYNHTVHTVPRRAGCTLKKKVFGWYPYWMGTAYTSFDFSLLSTFAYFSYEVNPANGSYTSIHSWKTTNSVTMAQAAGCRVELSVTLFGGTDNATFLSNLTSRQRCIDSLISLVQFRNADGVNIDFEGIPSAQRANFTAFMQSLSTQLKAAVPGASLSVALYAVDWNNVFDIPALDPYVDDFVIMGYDYYWSGSTQAGPTDPLYTGTNWGSLSLTRSILYYLGQGVTPSKLIVGLPYYGQEYNTVGSTIPSNTTSYVSSRTYAYARTNYDPSLSRTWDNHGITTGFIWNPGANWKQLWINNATSMAERFEIPYHKNIGGIGIWALGYDQGYPELWNLIQSKLTDCGPDYCSDTLYDSGGPMGNYRNSENYKWTIQSPNGETIKATFLSFNVEANFDYVYVYDGPTTASPLIGQYSGTTIPGPFISTGDALTFRFTSDGATVASGWQLKWNCEGPPIYADTIRLDHNDSGYTNCLLAQHVFLDSDAGLGGTYNNLEKNVMTFCSQDPAKAVRLRFNMTAAPVQLDLKSTVDGNDYLYFYDGPDTNANLIGVYTGSTSAYPQPGTIISRGTCLTVKFKSDANTTGTGWNAALRCNNPRTNLGRSNLTTGGTASFLDTGGGAGNYANNENYSITYCPSTADSTAGKGIWANFGAIALEQNYDYLHVFDGSSVNSRLICTYTGNDLHQNDLQTIKATVQNASGCLTFVFSSDGATNYSGWNASLSTGPKRLPYGSDRCATATLINTGGQPYAGSTTLATGMPNSEDPPLNIALGSLPGCSGANTITRLENSIWYKFSTPSTLCTESTINLQLLNISCQNSIPGGNGAQFVLYEAPSCQTGAGWGTPVYCADKLLQGAPVNVAGLLQPSRTYYILIDGFAGQHCNLDVILTGNLNGCILPIELVDFSGILREAAADLRWETSGEQNNAGFHVQRGQRLTGGSLHWQDIGWVDAAAPEGQGAVYTFSDPGYLRGQVNYYRLRQLDQNGASHYHKVISLSRPGEGELTLNIWPNPFRSEVRFELGTAWTGVVNVDITDLSGRTVYQAQHSLNQEQEFTENLSALAPGLYLYRVTVGGETLTGKLIRE